MAAEGDPVVRDERREVRAEGESWLARGQRFFLQDLWAFDLRPRSITARLLKLVRLAVIIGEGFVRDHLLLRASALTYVTVLSLIPLLVVAVAIVNVVGGEQALLDLVLDQLTAVSPSAREALQARIEAVDLRSFGTLGATVLVATSVLALRHLETTLNEIWGVKSNRSWPRRFADYLAVMVVAPILTAVALSLATTLQSEPLVESMLANELFRGLHDAGLARLPQLMMLVAFSFLYWFFPNTRVRFTSALIGGLVASILFSAARFVYIDFSLGAARYSVLFGGMVALPLILVWIYTCWAVVLFGAEVAFAHQNLAHYSREWRVGQMGPAERESLGLSLALEVARAFCDRGSPPSATQLSEALDLPIRSVREHLAILEAADLIVVSASESKEGGYLPARPPDQLTVAEVLAAVRGARKSVDARRMESRSGASTHRAVEGVLRELEDALDPITTTLTLADVLATSGARPA